MTKPDEAGRQAAGRVVRARRGEMGLTQQELADKADLDVKTVYSLEAGQTWPIARSLGAVSRVLGFAPGYLRDLADGELAEAS